VVNVMPQPPYPRERKLVPFEWQAGWTAKPVATSCGGDRPFEPRIVQPAAYSLD
jgi:hypothetical protein